MDEVKKQIHRYFVVVHGEDYVYRAPETFDNVLERWMYAVMNGNLEFASEQMAIIEHTLKEARRGGK
jgi:hypothetical protein